MLILILGIYKYLTSFVDSFMMRFFSSSKKNKQRKKRSSGHDIKKSSQDSRAYSTKPDSAPGPKKAEKIIKPKPPRKPVFSSQDYTNLCTDRYGRFQLNSPVVGNVVLYFNGQNVTASQYAMPVMHHSVPRWEPLSNIEQIQRFGITGYQAQLSCGTKLFSNRGYKFTDWNNCSYEIRPFSLPTPPYAEPFWGSTKPHFNPDFLPQFTEQSIRGGNEVEVEYRSFPARTVRSISQTEVMNGSALQAYQSFYAEHRGQLTPEIELVFDRILNAKARTPALNKFYPEWHHVVGHQLAPTWMDPQVKSNLGGGPQWSNTMMMVFEILCQWHARQSQDVFVSIKPTFFMLFASDLIEKIHYEAFLSYEERYLKFHHTIEPMRQADPIIPQASDVAQITGIAQSILTNVVPHCSSTVANVDVNGLHSLLNAENKAQFVPHLFKL
ncbi:hypothetical protein [uncultured Legionella sp.]|uniref:hypothetical protein n=1 Tax=uncultured Legionella sp. TaxID=210934 RepID=UPI00262C8CF0|nr:hypothetical protein [uncultured Legionella sp.]